MALPTLDATFASAADLPRRQMLARWLVGELGSGSVADYWLLPERYLWAKIAVAAGAPREEAAYISLPKNYAWSDIYNAVSGDVANSTVVVSGLSETQYNGSYVYDGDLNGKPSYRLNTNVSIYWEPEDNGWIFGNPVADEIIASGSNVVYPWLASNWYELGANGFNPAGLVITAQTPNHTDWSENVALGHIAAAYRGDTANPANLATYIDWPWRYKVASIITSLLTPPEPEGFNAVIVSGAGISAANGTYVLDGQINDKNKYSYGANYIYWDIEDWILHLQVGGAVYFSDTDTEFPWDSTPWIDNGGGTVAPTLTPTNV